jgi:hypothetical protein
VILVDRGVPRWDVEGQPEGGLAGRPNHPRDAQPLCGGERVVVHRRVVTERGAVRSQARGGDGREVHDRLAAGDRLQGLPEVGEIGAEQPDAEVTGQLAVPAGPALAVDRPNVVALLEEVAAHDPPGLASGSGDRDGRPDGSVRARRPALEARSGRNQAATWLLTVEETSSCVVRC